MALDANGVEIPPVVVSEPKPLENELAEWKRKAEEAERREQEARREADVLREQRLREMATQHQPQPVVEENEEQLNTEFNNAPAATVKKMIEKRAADIDRRIEQRARQIFAQEAKKFEAIGKYPDLRNPQSDFFKKVAYYMDTHPEKYNDPEGILDACARVTVDLGIMPQKPEVAAGNERVRQSVASAASQVSGSGNAPVGEAPELDAKGLELATKLGIDPKVYAKRLKDMQDEKGEYAPRVGKTGRASLTK